MFRKPKHDLKLPADLRSGLRKSFGRTLYNSELLAFLKEKNYKRIICIGDFISFTLLKNNIVPDVIVVDSRVERKQISADMVEVIDSFRSSREATLENPPGTISRQSWEIFQEAVLESGVRITVEGEEDLLAIPAILSAHKGSVVLYGLPGKGIAVVEPDEKTKDTFIKLIEKFEVK